MYYTTVLPEFNHLSTKKVDFSFNFIEFWVPFPHMLVYYGTPWEPVPLIIILYVQEMSIP